MCDHCGCHDIPPIGELSAEHERILALAWAVTSPVAGERFDGDAAVELMAVLDLHTDKEETGLYPLLDEMDDLAASVRQRLERDHVTVLEALASGRFTRSEFYALAAHIEQEEDELFPMAMFGFDDEMWDRMTSAHRAATVRADRSTGRVADRNPETRR